MNAEHRKSGSSAYESEPRKAPILVYLVAYVIPYLTLAVVALYWPAHSAPFGIDFTDSRMATMVPSITAYIEKSKFPHATAAYLVLSAFLFFPYFVLASLYPIINFGSAKEMRVVVERFKSGSVVRVVLAIILCIGLIFCAWWKNGQQFNLMPVSDRRGSLAVGGVLSSFYLVAYFMVNLIIMVIRFGVGGKSRDR